MNGISHHDLKTELDILDENPSGRKASRADRLRVAQMCLQMSCDILEEVIDETGDEYARAYLLDQLEIHASSGHRFVSRDLNFDNLIEKAEKQEQEDETESDALIADEEP